MYLHSFIIVYSTIRVWNNENASEVIEAHKPAVLAIDGMFDFDGTERVFTGLFDKFFVSYYGINEIV